MHLTKALKVKQMFSNLNRALSWAITSFGNKFCLEKRSGLITALDNSFYVKFMQLEIGLFTFMYLEKINFFVLGNQPSSTHVSP